MSRDNAAGFAALQEQIARIRALGTTARDVAPAVAEALRSELTQQIAEGVDPSGKPWKLTAKGKVPLRKAAARLEVRAIGTAIVATLSGPAALHHLGMAAGRISRRVLPGRTLNGRVIAAIKRALAEHVARIAQGKRGG